MAARGHAASSVIADVYIRVKFFCDVLKFEIKETLPRG